MTHRFCSVLQTNKQSVSCLVKNMLLSKWEVSSWSLLGVIDLNIFNENTWPTDFKKWDWQKWDWQLKASYYVWFLSWSHCKQSLQFLLINVSLSIVEYNCIIKLLLSLLFIDNLSMPDLNVHNSVTYDINTEVTCKSHNSLSSLYNF